MGRAIQEPAAAPPDGLSTASGILAPAPARAGASPLAQGQINRAAVAGTPHLQVTPTRPTHTAVKREDEDPPVRQNMQMWLDGVSR